MGRDRPRANARRDHRHGDRLIGRRCPGATVTVTNTATRGTRNTTTNAEGLYTFPAVPPGSYELKVELQGFKTAEIRAFKVDVQQTVRLDVTLEVGAVGETVTVVGQSTLLNTESTTLGTVIENKIVTELPLNGRQYLNLVAALAQRQRALARGGAGGRPTGRRARRAVHLRRWPAHLLQLLHARRRQ